MKFQPTAFLACFVVAPVLFAQNELTGAWQADLPTGETVILDLVVDGNELNGSVEFENGRMEDMTEGTVAAVGNQDLPRWRIRFVTAGLLNDQEVFVLWEGGSSVGQSDQITMRTRIQCLDGSEVDLYSTLTYVRLEGN